MCGTTNHLVNNKVRTKAVHLRDKLFQHLWAVGHPNHPDFCLNKMDTCLTVYGYTSRNLNTFTKSLALYVQSFIQNLFLFPMFCRDSIVLSVKWSWEFEKLFICKNLLVSDLLLLNVLTLFQNGSHTSLCQFYSTFASSSFGSLAGPNPYWLLYPQKTRDISQVSNFPLSIMCT